LIALACYPEPVQTLLPIHELRLKAKTIGIRKIECYDQGEDCLFDKEPQLKPMTIIQLIQNKPSTLQNWMVQDKLRFLRMICPIASAVSLTINTLLDNLLKPAA